MLHPWLESRASRKNLADRVVDYAANASWFGWRGVAPRSGGRDADVFQIPYNGVKGLRIVSRPAIARPSWMSSDQSVVHPASRAAATIIAS